MNPLFTCPACETRFRAEERFVGKRVRCPNPDCSKPMVLELNKAGTLSPTSSLAEKTPRMPPKAESSSISQNRGTRSVKATQLQKPVPSVASKPSSSARAASDSPAGAPNNGRRSGSASRRVGQSRYETRNPLLALFFGFGATCVLGGLALGAYWYSTKPSESLVAESAATDSEAAKRQLAAANNSDSGGVGASKGEPVLTASALTQQKTSAVGKPSSGLGAAQLTSTVSGEALRQNATRQQQLEDKVLPFLVKHCSDCHNATEQEGGLVVHDLATVDQLLKDRKKWERVYRMINAGAMPPQSYDPQPEDGARQEVAEILHKELFEFDCHMIHHAGRSTLHRLNRAEYNNTIRDLFGVSITPADKFPQDDVGEGFDNIGDVLSIPPLLMEKYLDAAEEVASAVIDTRDFSKGTIRAFKPDAFKSTLDGSVNEDGFYILHTNGSVTVDYEASGEGKYKIRIEAAQTQAGDESSIMAIQIDGATVHEFKVRGHRKPDWFEHEVKLSEGSHTIAAAFTNDFFDEKASEKRRDRNLGVGVIEVTGPEGGGTPQWHDVHRKIVTVLPSDTVSVKDAATSVLRPLLYRGFRRPVTDEEVSRFASLVDQTVNQHKETYEYGLFVAVQAMLISTDFLFRKEADPEGTENERVLNDHEIATRLSYFLWSSMPDEQLFQLAENKRLLDPAVLRGQIERMLRDDKAQSLAQNFASQWLNLRNLADVRPNPDLFPDFDDALRTAMAQETSMLFNTIVREDRSIDEFLSADYTFLNERLAKHYGLSGVSGDQFVRVSLEGSNRVGVLTHASILTLTSNPGRTSPVKRGKWILENILGDAPPPAPPGVPALEEAAKDLTSLSLRQRLEIHRKDPGCASCHKTMDPLGMGLENFDAVGRWRDKEGENQVDASGDLPTGEKFTGPIELVSIIRSRREKFARTLVERLMVYALGRGLEYYDKCAVDKTIDLMKQRGNRFSALVEGIVTSDPFLKKSRTRESVPTASP